MTYITVALRREVVNRSGGCCEYCRVHQRNRMFPYEIDHIIAEKHGGATVSENLCLSCYLCNGFKGSDIGSVDWVGSGTITFLFNPRQEVWTEHFRLVDAEIEPLTPEGRVTVFLLPLNALERITERELLIEIGQYPCESFYRE